MKRLAALVAAVALVAGAVWLRGRLTDDDGSASGPSAPPAEYRLLCVTELRAVCESLDGQSGIEVLAAESAGETEARLAAGDADFDGWLTPRSWAELVAVASRDALGAEAVPVASSPLVLAAQPGVLTVLPCAAAPTWRCVGDAAGSFRIGADRPTDGAWGLPVLGQQAQGWFPGGAAIDVEDSQFRDWLGRIRRSSSAEGSPDYTAATRLVTERGRFDAVGTVAAGLPPAVQAVPIEPSAAVELVLAAPADGGAAGDRRLNLIREALTDAGWAADAPAAGSLPSGGTLVALRDLWEGISR